MTKRTLTNNQKEALNIMEEITKLKELSETYFDKSEVYDDVYNTICNELGLVINTLENKLLNLIK